MGEMMETLTEAKEFLKANFDKGVECPCCKQFVRLYKRKINYTQALALINLYKLDKQKKAYYHVSIFDTATKAGGGDFAKLVYWGFIAQQYNEDQTKRTSGQWRITEFGRDFVEAKVYVDKYALVYNGECLKFEGERIDIKDALGTKFDYSRLMNHGY